MIETIFASVGWRVNRRGQLFALPCQLNPRFVANSWAGMVTFHFEDFLVAVEDFFVVVEDFFVVEDCIVLDDFFSFNLWLLSKNFVLFYLW